MGVFGLNLLLCYAVLAVDSSAGPGAIVLAAPVALIVFGVGRAARQRSVLNRQLRSRDEELRQLRDERAALIVADDRARLSRQLDGLLQERLDQLSRAAESAGGLAPAQARALLETIETDSRRTMDDMREIVGLLRGGEVDLTPAPTVAHLDALLARQRTPGSRLTVTGDPRSLPATVELSAYRIVEYLVEALGGLEVAIRFDDDALEIRVNGSVGRGGEVRAAVARARERARLLGGSVDAKVTRGRARVVALLPVLGLMIQKALIAALVTGLVVVPTAAAGQWSLLTVLLLAAGLPLMWWREHPRLVAPVGGAFWLAAALIAGDGWFPDPALVVMALLAGVTALAFRGRAAWVAGAVLVAYLGTLSLIVESNLIALAMFSVPAFLAGTVLRLRRETARELAERGRELEEERELFADLALRHERARIAAELHDIIGHAISVMIIQAAAGQRLVERDPVRARETFGVIAESARQGQADLRRLVDLLGGTEAGGPDLSLIDEVVTRAARSGLDVTCRFEGERAGVAAPVAHLAFRVVQESLTNALRHAPGSPVRVLVTGEERSLRVRVENDPPRQARLDLGGTGRGLTGLRERLQERGGHLSAGPSPGGGWVVVAALPGSYDRP